MSTVAYNDGIIACDHQITLYGSVYKGYKKFFRENDDMFGLVGGITRISDFLRGEDIYQESEEDQIDAFCIREGEIWTVCVGTIDDWDGFRIDSEHFAIGSGRDTATSCMELGGTAVEAIKMACKFDVYSSCKEGGPSWEEC